MDEFSINGGRLWKDILVPWAALNGRRHNNTQYAKETERKRRRLATEEMQVSMERDF